MVADVVAILFSLLQNQPPFHNENDGRVFFSFEVAEELLCTINVLLHRETGVYCGRPA
jgi:hypothetical protein